MPPSATPPRAEPAAQPSRPTRMGIWRRLQVRTNVVLQILLLAFIVAMVNAYAFKHFHQFDFTRDRNAGLSERTKRFLGSLTKPVKLIVIVSAKSVLQSDISNLADEYRNTQPKYINLEQIDPFRDYTRAKEIQAKYKLGEQENAVILDCEGRTKIITDDKMAEFDNSGAMMGQPPTVTAFTGEQAVTSALIEVSEGKKSNVYYVQGHGEPATGKGQALEAVNQIFESEHLTAAELNLLNAETIPADATVVMISGARYDLTEREVKLLGDYWEKGGRLMILLNPDAQTPHLAGFLARIGIRPQDDRVLRTLPLGNGYTGLQRDANVQIVGDTVIGQQLTGLATTLIGGTQSLALSEQEAAAGGIKLEPLMLAQKGFWGETDYRDIESGGGPYNDPAKDHQAPLYVAATAEKGAVGDQRVQVGAARMIVVGNSHFIESDAIDEKAYTVFLSGLNWLLEREALIGIAPKQIKTFSLNIPDEQTAKLFWMMILAIPGICAFLGLIVWWWRRRS